MVPCFLLSPHNLALQKLYGQLKKDVPYFEKCPGGDGIRINNVECGREPGKMYRVKKRDVLIVAGAMFRIV